MRHVIEPRVYQLGIGLFGYGQRGKRPLKLAKAHRQYGKRWQYSPLDADEFSVEIGDWEKVVVPSRPLKIALGLDDE